MDGLNYASKEVGRGTYWTEPEWEVFAFLTARSSSSAVGVSSKRGSAGRLLPFFGSDFVAETLKEAVSKQQQQESGEAHSGTYS